MLYPTPAPTSAWCSQPDRFVCPRLPAYVVMPALSDYQRGLEAAREDVRQGWARCWMPAAELAEEAVYCGFELSDEQLGYAAGLDEAFPGGVPEITGFLNHLRPGGVPEPPAIPVAIPVASVEGEEKPAGPRLAIRGQWGRSRPYNTGLEPFQALRKRLYLARFVYVNTHAVYP